MTIGGGICVILFIKLGSETFFNETNCDTPLGLIDAKTSKWSRSVMA